MLWVVLFVLIILGMPLSALPVNVSVSDSVTMEIVKGTDYVLGDEFAINLAEVSLVAPKENGKGTDWHRFEIILLYRNGHLHEYRRNMGLSKNFKAGTIRVMGGVVDGKKVYQEHTINELREMADDMRWNKQAIDVKELFQLA